MITAKQHATFQQLLNECKSGDDFDLLHEGVEILHSKGEISSSESYDWRVTVTNRKQYMADIAENERCNA